MTAEKQPDTRTEYCLRYTVFVHGLEPQHGEIEGASMLDVLQNLVRLSPNVALLIKNDDSSVVWSMHSQKLLNGQNLAKRFVVEEEELFTSTRAQPVLLKGLQSLLTTHNTNSTPEPQVTPQDDSQLQKGTKETRVVDTKTGGEKCAKLQAYDLIPPDALDILAAVYGQAVAEGKYSSRNWERGYKWSLSFAACMRHLWAFWRGKDINEETGLPHLGHAAWHCFTMLSFYLRKIGTDDRAKIKFHFPFPYVGKDDDENTDAV